MATIEAPMLSEYTLVDLEEGLARQSRILALTQRTHPMESFEVTGILATQEAYPDTPRLEWPLSIPLSTPDSSLPENFGIVAPGIYRSSYPQPQDFAYLQGLKLKTIITLVQKDLSDGFRAFIHGNGINHQVFDMAGTKKADIPLHMMQSIMNLLVDETNHPVLIHCKQGKHRTGCAVGVLRRYHGWDTRSVLAEYQSYAEPKVRETDIQYLSAFELAALSGVVPRKTRGAESCSLAGRCLFVFVACCLVYFLWLVVRYNQDLATAQAPPRRGNAWQQLH